MSTRKSTTAVGAKSEIVTKTTTITKEKECIDFSSVLDGADNTTATTATTTTTTVTISSTSNQLNATIKSEPDSPTQKMGNNTSSNNRVTRNSPLPLTPPTIKKEQQGIDSEPTNSEGEDNSNNTSLGKKSIRGRKSIKDNSKEPNKEVPKEDTFSVITEELSKAPKMKINDKENNTNDKESNENCKDNALTQNENEEIKEKDMQTKDLKESKCSDTKATNLKETKDKDSKDVNDAKESTDEKEFKEANDSKDAKDAKESNETKDSKELKDVKVSKDAKESKDTKDSKDGKASKDTKDSKEVATNRLTRHAVAQEVASNTRMTRNRQASSGASARPETPPVSGRRNRVGGNTRKTTEATVSQKRKRSVEDRSETPVSKMIKLEPKDPDDEAASSEPSMSTVATGNVDPEAVKIKQELIESDDGSSTTAEGSSVSNATATTTTTTVAIAVVGRGRGARWAGRKPTQTASPSTRSTRQSKVASPASSKSSTSTSAQQPKRRRTGGAGNSLRRSASASLLKTGMQSVDTNNPTAPDDDSKDSMASLMDELPLRDVVKLENLTPELDDIDMESKKSNEDDEKLEDQSSTQLSNGVDEPLSIETEVSSTPIDVVDKATVNKNPSQPDASNDANVAGSSTSKDASLSPELVSEGVSEISVKQFYKRPQFLENNLGIEEDPKLGEIVQKVTVEFDGSATATKSDATDENINTNEITTANTNDVTTTIDNDETVALNESFSAESLKEGELVYEESNDDGFKTPSNDGENSCINILPAIDGSAELNEEVLNNKVDVIENKSEEESLQEPLQLEEEDDGEDDDMTAEESETISMDNNPSLHDDAIEDDDEQEEQTESKTTNTIFEEIDELAQDGGLIDEIINDKTKETTNKVCDNEKAKLQHEEKNVENVTEEEGKSVHKDELKVSKKEEVKHKEESEQVKSGKIGIVEKISNIIENDSKIGEGETKSAGFQNNKPFPIESKIEIKILEKTENILKVSEAEIKNESQESSDSLEPMEVDETSKAEGTEVSNDEPNTVEEPKDLKGDIADSSRPATPKQEASNSNTNTVEINSTKKSKSINDEDNVSVKSTDTNSLGDVVKQENTDQERLRQKEQHLQNLGLLTHKAAEKRRQDIIQTAAAVEASRVAAAAANQHHSKRNGGKSAAASTASSATSHEYTGTLKTVIKLNRNSSGVSTGSTTTLTATTASTSNGSSGGGGRKSHVSNAKDTGVRRQSLKITFQKGRGRTTHHGSERNSGAYSAHGADPTSHGEDSYYTIQNENEGAHKNSGGSSLATATAGTKDQQLRIQKQQHNNNNNINNYNHYNNNNNIRNTSNVQTHGRKSYNSRSNTTFSYNYNHNHATHIDSSHSESHTDPHHHHSSGHGQSVTATSHKKDDREEILIPEKASSFKFHPGRLCEDQCYYCSGKFGLYDTPCHVGQIKSVERQLKILKNEEKLTVDNCLCDACFRHVDRRANVPSYKKRLSASGHLENVKTTDAEDSSNTTATTGTGDDSTTADVVRKCVVPDCQANAAHSLRRKCIRKSAKKYLLNFDMPTGSPFIWLCQSHYDAVVQCSGCVLCKRRLGKNHMYHITSDTERLEKALTDMGIPVQLGIGTAVCKLCRYFANLLMKPPDSTKSQKAEFVKNYRKRLLQFHNINDVSNEVSEADEDENVASTSKAAKRGKKEQRKAGSPTASSSSSLICANENAIDATSIAGNLHEQTQADNDEELMDFVEGDTSNEHSKSPSPQGSAHQDAEGKQNSRLKAILQSGGKSKNSDLPSALLRSNPNLSMRELFPGEEDLGLNFKAPFGSSNSQRTPEGWTRVQTFLQYDEPTRRLWEELQKPYGNQSSFLRHLILLEKYYRNGDLVLSPNASSNASVYTQTVRQRLTSYDQGHCGGLDVPVPATPPKVASPAKDQKSKEPETPIPLVEINDDDDEDDTAEKGNNTRKTRQNNDDDVIIQESPTLSNTGEKNASKQRSRSISVDKLTQQLSTNAVTIIARPKDAQQQQTPTASSGKSGSEPHTPKRNDSTKLQASPSGSKTQNNIANSGIGSLVPLSSSSTTTIAGTSIPGSIASSNNNSGNARSILKSNLLGMTSNKSVEILPISSQKSSNSIVTATTVNIPTASGVDSNSNLSSSSSGGSSKQQKILEVANKLQLEAAAAAAAAANARPQQHNPLLTSPPELVSLQRRSAGSGNNSLASNIAVSTSSASGTTASLINAKRAHLMPNRLAAKPPPNVVILPDTLNTHERAESKSWRPTLMSVEENQHLLNKNGPLYQTADGRRLPGLVQVQSGGKPFLISIFDYNRMCILRREKLLRDQMLKAGKHNKSQQHQQQRHSSQHNSNFNKMSSSSSSGGSNTSNNNNNAANKQAQVTAAQQQLLQLMQFHNRQQHHQQQQQQQAAMKNTPGSSGRYLNIAPKPPLIPTSNSLMSGGVNTNTNAMNSRHGGGGNQPPNFPMPLLANALTNAAAAAAANSNAAAASLSSTPWLWSNFPDSHELLRSGTGGSNKLPPLLPKPTTSAPATITSKQLQQQQQQLLMDNNLMSKIPKSLTVIPQQKLMGSNNNANGSKE